MHPFHFLQMCQVPLASQADTLSLRWRTTGFWCVFVTDELNLPFSVSFAAMQNLTCPVLHVMHVPSRFTRMYVSYLRFSKKQLWSLFKLNYWIGLVKNWWCLVSDFDHVLSIQEYIWALDVWGSTKWKLECCFLGSKAMCLLIQTKGI